MLSGSNVELCAVERARQGMAPQAALGQESIAVRAVVVDSEELTVHSTHHDTVVSQPVDTSHPSIGQIVEITVT